MKHRKNYCVENGLEPPKCNDFSPQDATLLALLSGRVDFLVNDASYAAYIAEHAKQPVKLVVPDILPKWINGIVAQKGKP